jgi:hypothetical protein
MTITLEKVESVKSRMNVTYKEAKEALEKTDGNELEAMILLEENGFTRLASKTKNSKSIKSDFLQNLLNEVGSFIKSVHSVNFNMLKDGKIILAVPLTILFILAMFMLPLLVFGLLIGWAMGYQFEVRKHKSKDVVIDEFVEDRDKD